MLTLDLRTLPAIGRYKEVTWFPVPSLTRHRYRGSLCYGFCKLADPSHNVIKFSQVVEQKLLILVAECQFTVAVSILGLAGLLEWTGMF
jgi:hypothetical protein